MKQISTDVYWLELGFVNSFICKDEDGLTLVDCGMPWSAGRILKGIRDLGFQPADVKRILITHADIDHAGSAAAIEQATGATIHASQATADLLVKGRSPAHMPALVQFFLDHFMGYEAVDESAIDVCSESDSLPVLGGLQMLATPGHTLDHHSFFSAAHGILFSGDALNTRSDRLQSTPERITADLDAARGSAIRLLELSPALYACGHGVPIQNHSEEDVMTLFNQLRK